IPYYEYQSETQVLLLICGSEDTRRTPEPTDLLPIPADVIELLRTCWFFNPYERAEASECQNVIGRIPQVKSPPSPTEDPDRSWAFPPQDWPRKKIGPDGPKGSPSRKIPGKVWGLTEVLGFMTATASEDWTLLMKVCDEVSTEAGAAEAAKALRYEFKYAEAPAMLSAARLWAIMLRNTQAPFVQATSTKKFLDVVEDALDNPDTSPVVRDRLMFVLAGASAQFGPKFPNFRSSWRKVKPREAPVEGIPFDPKDPIFGPPPTRLPKPDSLSIQLNSSPSESTHDKESLDEA
ncbi:hypothetical protein FS837_001579, partial [Tulasnella sp. UAMH 9824]